MKIDRLKTSTFPCILQNRLYEGEIFEMIKKNEIYGFVYCSLQTPNDIFDVIRGINFPPIIRKEVITMDHLSEYMKRRVLEEATMMPRTTVIQSYNATDQLFLTEFLAFYMDLGLKPYNLKYFIQYKPSKCMKPFVDDCVSMRIEAAYDGNPQKGLTAKVTVNSG